MTDDNDRQIELIEELNNRMGVIISLLFRMIPRDNPTISLKEQITILNNLGLRPRDIAAILGRTAGHINKELVGIRKITKKESSNDE